MPPCQASRLDVLMNEQQSWASSALLADSFLRNIIQTGAPHHCAGAPLVQELCHGCSRLRQLGTAGQQGVGAPEHVVPVHSKIGPPAALHTGCHTRVSSVCSEAALPLGKQENDHIYGERGIFIWHMKVSVSA